MKKNFLVIVIAFALLSNILWIRYDHSPPLWDMAGHSERSLYFAVQLREGHLQTLFRYDTIYPPLTYTITALLFLIFGWHEDIPQYSLQIFLILFFVSVYGISVELFSDRKKAVLTSILVFFYPLTAHFTRIYLLDFPLTTLITFSLFALLKSRDFKNSSWTLVFAATSGLAMLTKWTAFIFLLGPVFLTIVRIIHKKSWRTIRPSTIVYALLIIFILVAPWYAEHFSTIRKSMIGTRLNVFSVPTENLWGVKNILFYPRSVGRVITWPLMFFVVWGFGVLLWRRSSAHLFLLAWIVPAYFIMTFLFYSKEVRYMLPLFPALAMLSLQGPQSLSFKGFALARYKNILLSFLTFGIFFSATVVWTETSWQAHFLNPRMRKILRLEKTYGFQRVLPKDPRYGFTYPTSFQTTIKEIPEALFADASLYFPNWNDTKRHSPLRVAVVPNSIFLTAQQVQYSTHLFEYEHFGTALPARTEFSLSTYLRASDWRTTILKADYLITKTGDQGPKIWAPYIEEIAREEKKKESEVFSRFQLVKILPLSGIETKKGVPVVQEMRLYRRVDK